MTGITGEGWGTWLPAMLGGDDDDGGPPFTHRHALELTETEDAFAPASPGPSFTVERRAACRYCGQEIVLGKHGWRLDVNDSPGYECPDAPRGYHGIDKAGGGTERRRDPEPDAPRHLRPG